LSPPKPPQLLLHLEGCDLMCQYAFIAGVSLLVGSIGTMEIMLVSVTSRGEICGMTTPMNAIGSCQRDEDHGPPRQLGRLGIPEAQPPFLRRRLCSA
jgi:hypothetical protein